MCTTWQNKDDLGCFQTEASAAPNASMSIIKLISKW